MSTLPDPMPMDLVYIVPLPLAYGTASLLSENLSNSENLASLRLLASLLGARMLLGAPGLTARSKKLLGTKTTRRARFRACGCERFPQLCFFQADECAVG